MASPQPIRPVEKPDLTPRRCANCGKRYTPKQPPHKGQKYGFCNPKCKKQFHRHGCAYIQLKDAVQKFVKQEVTARMQEVLTALEETRALVQSMSVRRPNRSAKSQ
jgi:YHS domain-containing protein